MENSIETLPSSDIETNPSTDSQIEPNTKPSTRKRWIMIGTVVIVLIFIATYFAYKLSSNKEPVKSEVNKSTMQIITNSLSTALQQINPTASSEPSPTPSPTQSATSLEEMINLDEYEEKQIQFQNNDGPSIDKENLKIKIPGEQSRHFVSPVLAADLQSLYPIYMQNPTVETLNKIASNLNIQASPTRPESNKEYLLEYKDPQAKLVYDPSQGSLSYEAIPASGDLPTYARAEEIARSTLASLGISLENERVKVVTTSISSIYENFASVHPAIAVNFLSQNQNLPVVFSDVDFFTNSSESDSLSPLITILITGDEKITRIFYGTYAQHLGPNPIMMNDRTLTQAIEELKKYGGHIRKRVELDVQRTNFACADNKCSVHDATITKAYRGYNWSSGLSSLSYYEINDLNQRAFDYLLPVWIFEGTGMMDKAKVDESGKLIPNPDKNDNDQFYSQKVKFTSTVPAFTGKNDINLLEFKNYVLESVSDHQAKVTFQTKYLFPTFSGASFAQAEPRNGMRYKLLVLFPDKTYSVINGYKQEVYPGEITFDVGDATGEITTYLELPDFTNIIEKRTLIIK